MFKLQENKKFRGVILPKSKRQGPNRKNGKLQGLYFKNYLYFFGRPSLSIRNLHSAYITEKKKSKTTAKQGPILL